MTHETVVPAPRRCRLSLAPAALRAGQWTSVRVLVTLAGNPFTSERVRLTGPGISRTLWTNGRGIAADSIRVRRAGTLRATVRASGATAGCGDTSRVRPPQRKKAGVAGAGARLTGRAR